MDVRKFAADFPAVPEYQYRLATSLNGLGNHLGDLRRFEEAEVEYDRSINILQKLVNEYPNEPRYRMSLAVVFANMGGQFKYAERYTDAEKAYRRATELWPRVFETAGGDIAFILTKLERYAAAEAACRRAVGLKPDDCAKHTTTSALRFSTRGGTRRQRLHIDVPPN